MQHDPIDDTKPEADALEQQRDQIEDARDPEAPASATPRLTDDANEADVLEQAREVPLDDEFRSEE